LTVVASSTHLFYSATCKRRLFVANLAWLGELYCGTKWKGNLDQSKSMHQPWWLYRCCLLLSILGSFSSYACSSLSPTATTVQGSRLPGHWCGAQAGIGINSADHPIMGASTAHRATQGSTVTNNLNHPIPILLTLVKINPLSVLFASTATISMDRTAPQTANWSHKLKMRKIRRTNLPQNLRMRWRMENQPKSLMKLTLKLLP